METTQAEREKAVALIAAINALFSAAELNIEEAASIMYSSLYSTLTNAGAPPEAFGYLAEVFDNFSKHLRGEHVNEITAVYMKKDGSVIGAH